MKNTNFPAEMSKSRTYLVLGLMSGTSLDGLDIAACRFSKFNDAWEYEIVATSCYQYSDEWKDRLRFAHNKLSKIALLDHDFGSLSARYVLDFIKSHQLNVQNIDLIASHGHTVLHQPENCLTLQVGDGKAIADICQIPVVYDFRTADVKMGGQGAPLVPIGDQLLFSEYDQCLNLGGFSNVSYNYHDNRIAFDICPVNFVMNHLASQLNLAYDKDGKIARLGRLDESLFIELESLPYYQQQPPKSLGREWVEAYVYPLLNQFNIPIENKMNTMTMHVVSQLSKVLKGNVLVTGGGAKNKFMMEKLKENSSANIHIPDEKLIDYKEAVVFAFLGLLRWRNEVNILSSVTGAPRDHCAGQIANP